MLIDGPSLLALAVVLGAVVYYVFFRNVWLARRMKPLVEMLDAGTARLEGGRLSGAYSGKRVWFEYRAQTRAGPAAMRIGVACASSHSFRIHKKAESLQPAERACLANLEEGTLQSVKSGDPLWDSELALAAEGEASFRRWINRPDVHETVARSLYGRSPPSCSARVARCGPSIPGLPRKPSSRTVSPGRRSMNSCR